MLRTTTAQKFTSTKIYDLLIGLGAEKKSAEIAIGEFVELVPKALASSAAEAGLDTTLPTDKGDIWRLESIISDNKNDTDIKLKEIEGKIIESKSDLEKTIAKIESNLKETIAKNKSATDLKIEKMRTEAAKNKSDLKETIAKNKSDTDLKIERMRTEAEKNKNTLLFWGVSVQLAVGGLVVTILQLLQN